MDSDGQDGYGRMIADTAPQHSNSNVIARMSNEGVLLILYSIGFYPPFDIWILPFDISVEIISKKQVTWFRDTTLAVCCMVTERIER
jgi:hypothetical protein